MTHLNRQSLEVFASFAIAAIFDLYAPNSGLDSLLRTALLILGSWRLTDFVLSVLWRGTGRAHD
jgi:hypothetical protein